MVVVAVDKGTTGVPLGPLENTQKASQDDPSVFHLPIAA